MAQLQEHLMWFLNRCIKAVKDAWGFIRSIDRSFFYDSYTGYKKKRIVITGSTFVLLCSTVTAVVILKPSFSEIISDDIISALSNLLPAKVIERVVTGYSESAVLEYPDTAFLFGGSRVVPAYGIKPVWGPPERGDIVSYVGSSSDQTTKETKSTQGSKSKSETKVETAKAYTGKYKEWNTTFELQGLTLQVVESIQNDVLLQANNAIQKGTWEVYAQNVRVALVDMPSLGQQIRPNLSEKTVQTWTQLEKVYADIYKDIYACTNEQSLIDVATSSLYKNALELTAQLVNDIENERNNAER